ncbi:MAG: PIG-L family deacetylase, partial [Oscillospiraceae bacterium]|nr:PIG-L family deacetylase [Oscillospiraceae bacterium]
MRNNIMKRALALTLAAAVTLTFAGTPGDLKTNASAESAIGTVYYVSFNNGDDNKLGTSQANAWKTFTNVNETVFKPGDKILLERGSVWDDAQLSPKGSGSGNAPIIIDAYGNGDMPRINARNMEWYPNFNYNDDVSNEVNENRVWNAPVVFYNQQYWEINNLEVTNFSPTVITYHDAASEKTKIPNRDGILIVGKDAGVLRHMYVRNCYIHGVNAAYTSAAGIGRGGLVYLIRGKDVRTRWDDIIVEGNRLGNINDYELGLKVAPEHPSIGHYGVSFEGTWRLNASGTFATENGIPTSEMNNSNELSTNIIVRNNYFQDVGNAAVHFGAVENAVVEYNVLDHCNSGLNGNVPIWWHASNYILCQFNEAFDTGASTSKEDSQVFDPDGYAPLSVIQYNYTHDNPSGAYFQCDLGTAFVSHWRYNISVNDGTGQNSHDNGAVITYQNASNTSSRFYFYNNDVFIGDNVSSLVGTHWGAARAYRPGYIMNNLFYDSGKGAGRSKSGQYSAYDEAWSLNFVNSSRFDNNYYGGTREDKLRAVTGEEAHQDGNSVGGNLGINDLEAKIARPEGYTTVPGLPGYEASMNDVREATGWEKINNFLRDGAGGFTESVLYRAGKTLNSIGEANNTGGTFANGGRDIFGNYVSPFNPPSIGAIEIDANTSIPDGKRLTRFGDDANAKANMSGVTDENGIRYVGAGWRTKDNGTVLNGLNEAGRPKNSARYGRELYWNTNSVHVSQAEIIIPEGYCFDGFTAHTDNAAIVTASYGNQSKKFYLSSVKNSFLTDFTGSAENGTSLKIDIYCPWGASGVYFDELILSETEKDTLPKVNVALNKTAKQNRSGTAANAVDGSASTVAVNASPATNLPYIWAVDLGQNHNVDEVQIDWTGKAANDVTNWLYKIQYSADASVWAGATSFTTATSNPDEIDAAVNTAGWTDWVDYSRGEGAPGDVIQAYEKEEAVPARYFRVVFYGVPPGTEYWLSLRQFRAYGIPEGGWEGVSIVSDIAYGKPVLPIGGNTLNPREPEAVTDGKADTFWTANGDDLRIDLGLQYDIDNVNVIFHGDEPGSGDVTVKVSEEVCENTGDSCWETLGTQAAAGSVTVYDGEGKKGRYLLISANSGVNIVGIEAFGDERITPPRKIMIFGAHPDDETLFGGGTIKRAVDNGDDVYILMATNGDYNGRGDTSSGGQARMRETLSAMSYLGVKRENVYFLSFPDTGGLDEFGMTGTGNYYQGSALYRLYMNEDDPYAVIPGRRENETQTYNGSAAGAKSYYDRFFGTQVDYTRANFLMGVQDAFDRVRPDDIYTTSRYDLHADHAALGLFATEALINLRQTDSNYTPKLHETFVHSCASDERNGGNSWPKKTATVEPFEYPQGLDERTIFDWNRRESVTVPESMRVTPYDFNMKYQAILKYPSQGKGWITYFAKYDEFFWPRDFENLAFFADAAASSELSSARGAKKAIDGVRDGESTSMKDDFPNSTAAYIREDHPDRFPTAEWVSDDETAGAWLRLDWLEEITANKIVLYGRPKAGENVKSGELTFYNGNGEQVGASVAVGALPEDGRPLTIKLPSGINIQSLKFEITDYEGQAAGLAEIEVYGATVPMSKAISLNKSGLHTFPKTPFGEEPKAPLTVQVSNVAEEETGELTVSLSGGNADSFILSTETIGSIAVGGKSSFTVKPKAGLPIGIHSATVTVSGTGLSPKKFNVNFTVMPKVINLDISGTYIFPAAETGYDKSPAKSVVVSNGSDVIEVTGVNVTLEGANAQSFTVTPESIGTIRPGGVALFTVKPKETLENGVYDASVTISGDETETKSFNVRFIVAAPTEVTALFRYTFDEPSELERTGAWGVDEMKDVVWNKDGGLNGGGSLEFPNNNNYLAITGGNFNTSTSDFTFSMWIKSANVGRQQYLMGRSPGDDSIILRAGGYLGSYNMGGGSVTLTSVHHAPIKSGEWAHIAVTHSRSGNSSTVTYFLNGKQVHQHSGQPSGNVQNFFVLGGRYHRGATTGAFTGQMDEVGLYHGAMNATAVQKLYESKAEYVKKISLNADETYKFADAEHGYSEQTAKSFVVENIGNLPVGELTVALSGDDSFILSERTIAGIDVGCKAFFTLAPKSGLGIKNHKATVTVSGEGVEPVSFDVSFKVFGDDVKPPAGTITMRNNTFKSFMNTITFGMFFKNTLDVTITASDEESGIRTVEYLISETYLPGTTNWDKQDWTIINNGGKFSVAANFKGVIYARLTDNGFNETVICSNGVTVYTDSAVLTESVSFTKGSGEDAFANVTLNGNTIDKISDMSGDLTANTDYTVSGGTITLKAGYLEGLAKGEYTLTVTYNPLGIKYPQVPSADSEAPSATKITLKIEEKVVVPTEPPVTEPPVTEPPGTEPPATETPATETPATEPPATEPPATETPVTEPPATETPATEPPATETPVTETPVTETPVTDENTPSGEDVIYDVLEDFGSWNGEG